MSNLNFGGWANVFWILAATATASLVLGVLYRTFMQPWLSAIGGKTREQIGEPYDKRFPRPLLPSRPFKVAFIAEVLIVFPLALLIICMGIKTFTGGMAVGFLVWLGLVAISMVVSYYFRGARPLLAVNDADYWLTVLVTQGAIIGACVT